MADGFIALPPDSIGKRIRTQVVGDAHQEVHTLAGADGRVFDQTNRFPVDIGGDVNIGNLTVQYESRVSTLNSTTTLLAAGQSFTGGWEDVRDYAAISVAVFTDAPSATNGAVVQFTEDPAKAPIRSVATTIPANVGSHFSLAPQARYFRLWYMNGSTAQTVFRNEVQLKFNPPAQVQQPIGATITDLNLATITRSALAARIFSGPSTGAYAPLGTDGAGRLLTSNTGLTDAQLRASRVPVETGLTIPQPQTDALTDAQLRASRVPVDNGQAQALTDAQLRAAAVQVSGPLTDAQLRAKYVRVAPRIAYHAGVDGGRTAYNSTTDLLTISNTGEQPFCALVNPAGSGVDLHVHSLDQSASAASITRRYRNRTLSGLGVARPNVNRGGGSSLGAGRFYVPGQFTSTGGTIGQVRHIAANAIPPDTPDGSLILRPGDNLVWTIQGPGGGLNGTLTASLTPIWLERAADP